MEADATWSCCEQNISEGPNISHIEWKENVVNIKLFRLNYSRHASLLKIFRRSNHTSFACKTASMRTVKVLFLNEPTVN